MSPPTAVKTAIIFSFLLFVLHETQAGEKPHHHKGSKGDTTCGKIFNSTNGKISYHNKSDSVDPGVTCPWTVQSPTNGTVLLVFDLYLLDGDKIVITVNDKPLPFSENLKNGITPYMTDHTSVNISLTTTKVIINPLRTLRIFYTTNSECNFMFNQSTGIMHSPLYDSTGRSKWPLECDFKIMVQNAEHSTLNLWLNEFNFTSGTLNVSGTDGHDGIFNGGNFTNQEFLTKKPLDMKVNIANNSDYPESFVAYFDDISSTACSEIITLNDLKVSTDLSMPTRDRQQFIVSNQQTLTCQWLVDTDPNMTITINIGNVTLTSPVDQLLILDGPSRSSPVLLDVNAANPLKEHLLYSTGNHLWISAMTPFYNESFNIKITVSRTKSGGHMRNQGTVDFKTSDATYLLEVDSGKQVQLIVDNSTTVAGQAVVNFYQDFTLSGEPFYTLAPGKKIDVVVSPTEKMAIVTKNFGSSSFKGSFSGIDQGCYKYGQASGDTFSVSGHPNSTCAWIVKPVASSKDLLTFHFRSLSLGASDSVLIQKLDANQTKIASLSSNRTVFPDLWLPAETGAFVQVTRGDCKADSIAIQSSYQVIPGCENFLNPGPGEIITVSSPGYPNHYPLGSDCSWDIEKPKDSVFLLVSFKNIQLAQKDHTLKLFTTVGPTQNTTLIKEFNGTNLTLPDDLLVSGNLKITFSTTTQMPMESKPGFALDVMVVEYGRMMTNSTGTVETPDFPKPVNESALFAWMVQVESSETKKQILEFSFSNQANQTGIAQVLKIYNGASRRLDVVANYSENILSRTNQLLFVYQHSGNSSGPAFSVSYHNYSCNMSLLCDNHICMHDDWICNDINDCGDYSDEKNCDGGHTPPAPTPSPPAPPSEGAKGASVSVLTGSIVASLVVGAVLGVISLIGFQRYRSRQLSSYTSLSS